MTAGATFGPAGRSLGMAVTLAAALALAINNVSLPHVYQSGWNAQSVALARFMVAFAVVALTLIVTRRGFRLPGRDTWHALGSGAAVAIGAFGLLGSFQYIPVSLSIVIVYTYPVLTAVMLSLWHRQPPSLVQIVCLVIAFAGVAIATGIDGGSLDPRGLALALLSAAGFSFSFAWNSAKLRAADAMVVTFYMVASGGVVMAAFVLGSATLQVPDMARGWLLLLIPASCFTIAMLGMFEGVKCIGGSAAAMLMNLEPVFTVAFAPFVLGERLTVLHIAGGLLVIAAVCVSEWAGAGVETAEAGA